VFFLVSSLSRWYKIFAAVLEWATAAVGPGATGAVFVCRVEWSCGTTSPIALSEQTTHRDFAPADGTAGSLHS
jgi:hypothetical protein